MAFSDVSPHGFYWELSHCLNTTANSYETLVGKNQKVNTDLIKRTSNYITNQNTKIYAFNFVKSVVVDKTAPVLIKSTIIELDTPFPSVEIAVIVGYDVKIYLMKLWPCDKCFCSKFQEVTNHDKKCEILKL